MKTIFLSYSSQDYFFAEMLAIKLKEADYGIWRDLGAIRAGDDWRVSIEAGIRDCLAVVVALSNNSAESAYVTYEWAYALGMGKPVVPVKLSNCKVHPKLEPTQYIDFSYPRALPWDSLVERLGEIDVEADPKLANPSATEMSAKESENVDQLANLVLAYLNRHGFTLASYQRLRQYINEQTNTSIADETFDSLVDAKPDLFRKAIIKGGRNGIAKRMP